MVQPLPISTVRNKLLAALPPDILAQLLPKLHVVALPVRRTLMVPQGRIEAIYFIESGWVSTVAHLDDGTQTEIGLIGFEGMIGLPLVLGVDTAFADTYMQADGTGWQMEAPAFQHELEENPVLCTAAPLQRSHACPDHADRGLQWPPQSRAAPCPVASDGARPRR